MPPRNIRACLAARLTRPSIVTQVRLNIVAARPLSEPEFPAKPGSSIYQSLVEELRSPDSTTRAPRVRTALKAFNEITAAKTEGVTEKERQHIPWSSAYDPVTRLPFARDLVHLQLLLDALLAGKNYVRAESILGAMHPLIETPEFAVTVAKFVEMFAADELTSFAEVEALADRLLRQYKTRHTSRTTAVLLAKAAALDEACTAKVLSRVTDSPLTTRRVLSHMDVIGPAEYQVILANKAITSSHIPQAVLPLFEELRGEEPAKATPSYFSKSSESAPQIPSEMPELRGVDSFGLKVIRHTLLGLNSSALMDIELLAKDMAEDSARHLLHNTGTSNKRNYHEMYRQLKTPEDKERFNAALDVCNQTRQKELESKGVDAAREKWKHEFEEMLLRGAIHLSKSLNAQLYQWYTQMLPLVDAEVAKCRAILDGEKTPTDPEERKVWKERATYAPFLVLIPPKKMAVVTVLELLKLNSTGGIADGMRAARAAISVGKAIELEYRSQGLAAAEKKLARAWSPSRWKRVLRSKNAKPPSSASGQTFSAVDWEPSVYAKVGSVLVSLLLHVATVPVEGTDPVSGRRIEGEQPAFHHTYQFVHGQRLGIIRIHKRLAAQLASNETLNSVQPQLLPMLTPPKPWSSHHTGGYNYTPSALMRVRDSAETIAYVKAASDKGNLEQVYDGLNVLGSTAWTINSRILSVITHYWNTGEKFLDISPIADEPVLPPPLPSNAEPQDKAEYQRRVRHALNEASAFRSQRCDTNYKLEIARAFVGEKMYFPHNFDFRGRAYPLPPHLNHLGNDLTRSLFLFWEGAELGESGLRWLKVHLANLYGMDKAPLESRVAFVDDNLDMIRKVAEDPYAHEDWWTKADKPWQVLTVCFELNEAYKLENPHTYVSHVPVHQDGTCNGLQHYAALGGDLEGARQVNLVPADRPQDVYKFVAGLVEKRLQAEAEEGNEYAKVLQGRIGRKVVKQTVMTNVYGVTFVGAVAQIEKQLASYFDKADYDKVHSYALYTTSLVFASVRELFEGAHLIQDWLGESAKRISKSVRIDNESRQVVDANKPNHMSSVIWTTLLGLPCVQPYRVLKKQVVNTNLQDMVITDPFGATQVDARKQQTAFPPNFIHSLDATHMLMTASACGKQGLNFASVHDSYWTHARDVDKMNINIREQFVKLHEENLIVKLRDEFEKRYEGFLQVVLIPGDHELAKQIRAVRKQIVKDLGRALTVADEIYIEKKRQDLLKSANPRDQQLGKEMVTTVSLTESYDVSSFAIATGKSRSLQILTPLKFPEIPARGTLDVSVVKESPYFFS